MKTRVVVTALVLTGMGAGPLLASRTSNAEDDAFAALKQEIDDVMTWPALATSDVGFTIVRLSDGKTVYDRNGATKLVPASNMKLVSTAAALHFLKGNYRFRTEVYGEADADGVIRGDLTLKGYGDPYLTPERVWNFANRLYYSGVRRIRGNIVVDDSFFSGDPRAMGFEQDGTSFAYMAPTGALSVSFNALGLHVLPGKNPGDPAKLMLEPRSDYATIEGQVETIRRGRTRITVEVLPKRDRSVVVVSGQISSSDGGRRYWRRVDNPSIYAGEVFKATLQSVGIRVDGKVVPGTAPTGVDPLSFIGSPRLAEIIDRVNKFSNNFMAEQVARTLGAEIFGAPGTWEKAAQAIGTFLIREVGLEEGSYAVGNASGLHDVNELTPQQLVQILSYMHDQPEINTEYIASLAVTGGAGTLSHRLKDTEAALKIRAKTGTLSISAALSGFVSPRDRDTLAFSLLVNNYETPITEVWEAQDKLITLLAEFDRHDPKSKAAPLQAAATTATGLLE